MGNSHFTFLISRLLLKLSLT